MYYIQNASIQHQNVSIQHQNASIQHVSIHHYLELKALSLHYYDHQGTYNYICWPYDTYFSSMT